MADLKERFPIGSQWVDTPGCRTSSIRVVVGYRGGGVTVVYREPDGTVADLRPSTYTQAPYEWVPYVERRVCPDFERWANVFPAGGPGGHHSTRDAADRVGDGRDALLRWGVRDGKPFIEQVETD
jgi:hypothetical protein